MSTKGSWSRVKNKTAYDRTMDRIAENERRKTIKKAQKLIMDDFIMDDWDMSDEMAEFRITLASQDLDMNVDVEYFRELARNWTGTQKEFTAHLRVTMDGITRELS